MLYVHKQSACPTLLPKKTNSKPKYKSQYRFGSISRITSSRSSPYGVAIIYSQIVLLSADGGYFPLCQPNSRGYGTRLPRRASVLG